MPPSKEQHGKPLISLTNGKKLGEVRDLFLDANLTRVEAVFVGKEGLLSRKTLVVERARVQVTGIDAWLVTGPDVVVELSRLAGSELLVPVGSLRGREIQTDGGTRVATVDDVILDNQMDVIGFTLGRLFVQGPLAERKSIARAAITRLGSKETPMLTTLARAETQDVMTR
jgi:sporulation protein YlmC with PRC-barrel domain